MGVIHCLTASSPEGFAKHVAEGDAEACNLSLNSQSSLKKAADVSWVESSVFISCFSSIFILLIKIFRS